MALFGNDIEPIEFVNYSLSGRKLRDLSVEEAEELCRLADDFCILKFEDVKEAIANGITYNTTQKTLMELFEKHLDTDLVEIEDFSAETEMDFAFG